MVGEDLVAQAGAVNVDIDFGSGDALMTQHLLDGSQVGSALEQMGGKAVAQRVWADDLAHPSEFTQLFDDMENHLPGEHRASTVQEQDILAAPLGHLTGACLLQVEVNLLDGDW